jgi:hypothetical protein
VLVRRAVQAHNERQTPPTWLLTSDDPSQLSPRTADKRFRWSGAISWAWEDLNLRPHPYQQNAGNRCAKRCFRRSRSTGRAEVMCSHRVQLPKAKVSKWTDQAVM